MFEKMKHEHGEGFCLNYHPSTAKVYKKYTQSSRTETKFEHFGHITRTHES